MAEEPPLSEQIQDYANRYVRAGYRDEAEILQSLEEVFSEEAPRESVTSMARAAMRAAIAQIEREAATWPTLTDYDRLDLAFQQLEDGGIVARQDFSCCLNCGNGEIGAEIDAFEALGRPARGYVFFHQQDTESAIEGAGLHLAFGALSEDEGENLAVAREIVARLEACGLKTSWNGAWNRRIRVDMHWRRRWRCT